MPQKTSAPDVVIEAPAAAPPPVDLTDPSLYINRELSWLAFNQRVLEQANDPAHPLLERVKFLAIVGGNLDEFYMVRVATLLKKFRASVDGTSPDGLNTEQQLHAINQRAAQMLDDLATCWQELLRPLLDGEAIRFIEPADYTADVKAYLAGYFKTHIWPVLTPLAFDPGHPFPYISNLSHSFAVVVRHSGRTKFARVKVPDKLPRFIAIPERKSMRGSADRPAQTYAFIEDVIRQNIQELFPGTQVKSAHLFRIVRDTDIVIQEDEADDLLESVDRSLRQLRYGELSLLQVEANMPRRVLDILVENFEVEEDVVLRTSDRLGFADFMELTALHRPALKDAPFVPRHLWAGHDAEAIFDEIRYEDHFVHNPFESFASVESFLRAAVKDPHVVAIKMTLYRIGQDSPLVDMLIEAAEAGKQVAVLVELKARFDERNNIIWANRLEQAGIHVVYGLVNLKTHCKLCLVVRQEPDGIRRYAHIGTGNYNAATSKVYTDLGFFTSDAAILDDVSEVFNYLTGYSNKRAYTDLLVAPVSLRSGVRSLIEREVEHAKADRPARIIFKNNAITDPGIIRCLYVASQAGVAIDLITRGVCCLRPGVPGVSETIAVRSIVGRFLEHSRIYYFENGGSPEVFIGSADLMERNLDRRVEVLCPIRDPDLKHHLRHVVLDALLRDTDRASSLQPDGEYVRVRPEEGEAPLNSQNVLLEHYAQDEL
jgi:polyphosphate kinase